VEPYHKSLKQNASLEKSPTQTVTSQTNHFFAAVCGFIKLEMLKGATQSTTYLKDETVSERASSGIFDLRELQPVQFTVQDE
jgi:hypothetical protein